VCAVEEYGGLTGEVFHSSCYACVVEAEDDLFHVDYEIILLKYACYGECECCVTGLMYAGEWYDYFIEDGIIMMHCDAGVRAYCVS